MGDEPTDNFDSANSKMCLKYLSNLPENLGKQSLP